MANELNSNVSQIVLKKFAPMFQNDSVLTNTVDRQLIQGELNPNTGDTVYIKRPHQFKSNRTADGDISGTTAQNLISGKIAATISNYCTVEVEYAQVEEALKLNQLDEILKPVSDKINTDIEIELAQFICQHGALSLGTPGTAITKWSDIAQTGSFLKDLGVSTMDAYAVIDPWAAQNLADAQSSLGAVDSLVRTAWEDAQISRNFGGIRALMSNGLASRTAGTLAGVAGLTVKTTPTVTYTAVKDTYEMTVVVTGATTLTLKAGDQLEFQSTYWLNQQSKQVLSRNATPIKFTATVLEDATAVAGDVSVKLSGVAIVDGTNAQYNTVSTAIVAGMTVSVKGAAGVTYKPNLFYTKQAIAMGTVELPKLHRIDSAVMSSAKSGLSIRVHKYSDGRANKQMMRFDVLPAFAILNPHMAGQFYGNA